LRIEPAPPEQLALAAAVRARGCRAVIVGTAPYGGPLCEALAAGAAGHGAIIARFGVGHDAIDKAQARRNGVLVVNTPGVLDVGVAEHTLWLLGSLIRHISRLDARFHAGQFAPESGGEVRGKLLVVLGFGAIGRRVAAMAHFGFGMEVLACGAASPAELERREEMPLAEILSRHGAARYTADLRAALAEADVLSIHLPATPQTRRLLDAERLELIKAGALLVNTSRGAVLDEAALYDALAGGRLGGAALDVFEYEPYGPIVPEKDLRTLPNVVLTPHVASNTRQSNERMARVCVENLTEFFAGRFGGGSIKALDEAVGEPPRTPLTAAIAQRKLR
jgi:lactate dehydrogenase-like 2-hydroxyacid dehydrogenase